MDMTKDVNKPRYIATQVGPDDTYSLLPADSDPVWDTILIRGYHGIVNGKHDMAFLYDAFDSRIDDVCDILEDGSLSDSARLSELNKEFSYWVSWEFSGSSDISVWKKAAEDYCSEKNDVDDHAAVLTAMTGKKYEKRTLCGSCQSDWADMYYPIDDWDEERLKKFEADYWNTGTGFSVESPNDDDPRYVYCYGYNEETIRKEIAEAVKANPADVGLHVISGYVTTALYTAV